MANKNQVDVLHNLNFVEFSSWDDILKKILALNSTDNEAYMLHAAGLRAHRDESFVTEWHKFYHHNMPDTGKLDLINESKLMSLLSVLKKLKNVPRMLDLNHCPEQKSVVEHENASVTNNKCVLASVIENDHDPVEEKKTEESLSFGKQSSLDNSNVETLNKPIQISDLRVSNDEISHDIESLLLHNINYVDSSVQKSQIECSDASLSKLNISDVNNSIESSSSIPCKDDAIVKCVDDSILPSDKHQVDLSMQRSFVNMKKKNNRKKKNTLLKVQKLTKAKPEKRINYLAFTKLPGGTRPGCNNIKLGVVGRIKPKENCSNKSRIQNLTANKSNFNNPPLCTVLENDSIVATKIVSLNEKHLDKDLISPGASTSSNESAHEHSMWQSPKCTPCKVENKFTKIREIRKKKSIFDDDLDAHQTTLDRFLIKKTNDVNTENDTTKVIKSKLSLKRKNIQSNSMIKVMDTSIGSAESINTPLLNIIDSSSDDESSKFDGIPPWKRPKNLDKIQDTVTLKNMKPMPQILVKSTNLKCLSVALLKPPPKRKDKAHYHGPEQPFGICTSREDI